jgi:abortive infection bacteriophage resistance protein
MLKNRGLIISDEKKAISYLKSISYFRVVNYLRPMEQDKELHLYKPNSEFDNAISLYYFDKELSEIIFAAIQSIEIALRSKIIHYVSLKYGAFWFMEPSLFKNHEVYEQTISTIKKDLLRTKEDFIIEHNSKYTEPVMPPIWKTLEVTSFGTLSKLFCNIKDTVVKKQIARDFNLPQHVVLESWVKCAVAMRNYLAHHSRIWNRNFPIMPQFNSSFRGEWISNTAFPKVKLYSQLRCFQYMQKYVKTNWDFKLRLKSLLQQYPNVDIVAMGFPLDWENEPLWR